MNVNPTGSVPLTPSPRSSPQCLSSVVAMPPSLTEVGHGGRAGSGGWRTSLASLSPVSSVRVYIVLYVTYMYSICVISTEYTGTLYGMLYLIQSSMDSSKDPMKSVLFPLQRPSLLKVTQLVLMEPKLNPNCVIPEPELLITLTF